MFTKIEDSFFVFSSDMQNISNKISFNSLGKRHWSDVDSTTFLFVKKVMIFFIFLNKILISFNLGSFDAILYWWILVSVGYQWECQSGIMKSTPETIWKRLFIELSNFARILYVTSRSFPKIITSTGTRGSLPVFDTSNGLSRGVRGLYVYEEQH